MVLCIIFFLSFLIFCFRSRISLTFQGCNFMEFPYIYNPFIHVVLCFFLELGSSLEYVMKCSPLQLTHNLHSAFQHFSPDPNNWCTEELLMCSQVFTVEIWLSEQTSINGLKPKLVPRYIILWQTQASGLPEALSAHGIHWRHRIKYIYSVLAGCWHQPMLLNLNSALFHRKGN